MKTLAMALACTTLAACSLMPRYSPPPNPAPAAFKDYGAWEPAAPSDQRPRGDWWRAYGQAELDQLEQDLDRSNPDLGTAVARYQQASALASEARAALWPTVNAVGLDNFDRQSDNRPLRSASQPAKYRDELVGGGASYELDLWGRVRSSVAAGAASAQAAAADLESVRLLLHAELANDYMALRGEEAQLRLLQDTVAAYTRALELTTNRHNGGIASALDVARAQTQLETTRAELTDTTAARALYEHALAALAGKPAPAFALGPAVTGLKLPQVPVGLPATLLQRRPDVAAAERRMAAYNAGIGVTRAAFFPRLSLSAIAGFESTAGPGLLTAPNRFWAVGPQGFMTLFDAGYRSAAVAAARAQFDEAAGQYRSAVLTAFRDVEDALALSQLLNQELAQREAARTAAEQALDMALNRYREGAVNYLEVVTAQVAALAAQRSALETRTRELQASVFLVRAVGGGYEAAWPVTGG